MFSTVTTLPLAATMPPPTCETQAKIQRITAARFKLASRIRSHGESWLMPHVVRLTEELKKLEGEQDLLFQILAEGSQTTHLLVV